jgi:hypothetical protein
MIARLTVGSPTDDPPINNIESEHRSNVDPPMLAGRERILFRDVVFTIGTAGRILMDLAFAVRTRDSWFLLAHVSVYVVFVVVPYIFIHESSPFSPTIPSCPR